MVRMSESTTILMTGASGYVGALLASTLLVHTDVRIVALVRAHHTRADLLEPIQVECAACGHDLSAQDLQRITFVPLPESVDRLPELAEPLRGHRIDEVLHCAGCVDYFDAAALQAVNVTFTSRLLDLSKKLDVSRFVFVSTAFSCGYIETVFEETLPAEPVSDPTEYTRTKRQAERLVAAAGIPFLIVRPSILIGHSRTGRYSGKRYGLYQQWMGLERLLCNKYHPVLHTVAPTQPLNLVHQDSFQQAFLHAWRTLGENAILNVVSRQDTAPSMRALWDMWTEVVRPRETYYYDHLAAVPLKAIDMRQRAYLTFASVNLEIAAHAWRFSTANLDRLRAQGLSFADATIDSVQVCQDRFVNGSETLRKYRQQFGELLAASPSRIAVHDEAAGCRELA